MTRFFVFVLCGGLLATTSLGLEYSYLDRTARVIVGAGGSHMSDTFSDSMGPFSAALNGQVAGPLGAATGHALQESYVSPTHVFGSGEVLATQVGAGDAQADSYMMISFSLAAPTSIRLAGSVERYPGGGYAGVDIQRGYEWRWERIPEDGVIAFDEVLALPSGTYDFRAFAIAFGNNAPPTFTTWTVDLAVLPEPATAVLALMPALALRRRR